MSPHGYTYTPEPIEQVQYQDGLGAHTRRGLLLALVIAGAIGLLAVYLTQRSANLHPAPATEPLDNQRLIELRVEAFRAGYTAALQDNCAAQPTLALPLEAKP